MTYRGTKTPYQRYLRALRVGDRVELGGVAFGKPRFRATVRSVSPLLVRFRDPRFPGELSRVAAADEGYVDNSWMIQGPPWLYTAAADGRLRAMNKRPRRTKK